MSRRLAREVAFKALFQHDIGRNDLEPTLTELLEEAGLGADSARFARELAQGVVANCDEIDRVISRHLMKWTFPRLAGVDRSVLRLAAYELLYREDIPGRVVINEALEISKIFHDEEAAKFLNGVLDKIAREKGRDGTFV
jgi:N utilization substance protein B